MNESKELISVPNEGILSQNKQSAPGASGRQILYKPVEISSRDAKKISEVRKELGLEGESQLSLLEGISADSFNTAELEIVRAFYKNRKTRKDVINPDLHLRNSDRAITKAGALFRNITGKPAFTKNIEVDNNSKLEKSEDFSLHYFDVQHEVQPVFNEVEKSVTEFLRKAQSQKEDLRVLLNKKDYQTFEKKVWLGKNIVEQKDIPIEKNTLWQALKNAKLEISLTNNDSPLHSDGGGGGEGVGAWFKVKAGQSQWEEALGILDTYSVHEYTHAHQVAVAPLMHKNSFESTLDFKRHAKHPTEVQARVHQAIHLARKTRTDFKTALGIVLDQYLTYNNERIMKEKGAEEVIRNEAPKLHQEYFDTHYGQVKALYPYLDSGERK